MRSEQDIERLLEEHLEETARPMPEHVLENSIEATARTRQRVPGRLAAPWLRPIPGPAVLALAAAMLIVAIGLGMDRLGLLQGGRFGSPASPAPAGRSWDPVADFRTGSRASNPSADRYGNADVWAYLVTDTARLHDPSAYTRLPEYGEQPLEESWTDPSWLHLGIGASKPDGILRMMAYVAGDGSFAPVLAWRSPVAGSVRVRGTVSMAHRDCPAQNDGVTLWIDLEGETLDSRRLLPEATDVFDVTADVGVGQSLYFLIDPGPSSECDETDFQITITAH